MTMLARKLHRLKLIFSTRLKTKAFFALLSMGYYCQYKFITEQKLFDQIKKNGADVEIKPDRNITVFYNVYTNPSADPFVSKQIVQEQMLQMKPYHKVFVRSIGKKITSLSPFTIRHDEEGNEIETLEILFQHCKQNPGDTVVYLHNKGSFHPNSANDKLRRFLTRGSLSHECANLPSTCNVCSSRMSPLPHPHTSGNMWAAKCEYVRKLISPTELDARMKSIHGKLSFDFEPCLGAGRYAAEHWIHSHPSVLPCDLSIDDRFTWYKHPVPESNFTIVLESAPRYEFKKYRKTNLCPPFLLDVRLKEYKALYNETPAASWWGWKFYDIPREDGEWCRLVKNVPIDPVCGGLWKAKFPSADNIDGTSKKNIHFVVSHCKSDLGWISAFTKGYDIASIDVISKCGKTTKGLAKEATVHSLSNVGQCDHSYAYYINSILDKRVKKGEEKDSVIFFLKDDMSPKKILEITGLNDMATMMTDVLSSNGFACGIDFPDKYSPYHNTPVLFDFHQDESDHKHLSYNKSDMMSFRSNYTNLGAFFKAEIASVDEQVAVPELVQVCYGGVFATTYQNIKKTDPSKWRRIEKILSRGDSIEEVHFMERLWGLLLATPLRPYLVNTLNILSQEHVNSSSEKILKKNMLGMKVKTTFE